MIQANAQESFSFEDAKEALGYIQAHSGNFQPSTAVVLGSGLGGVADELEDETLALEASGELDEASAIFFPDQTEAFCRAAEKASRNLSRFCTRTS